MPAHHRSWSSTQLCDNILDIDLLGAHPDQSDQTLCQIYHWPRAESMEVPWLYSGRAMERAPGPPVNMGATSCQTREEAPTFTRSQPGSDLPGHVIKLLDTLITVTASLSLITGAIRRRGWEITEDSRLDKVGHQASFHEYKNSSCQCALSPSLPAGDSNLLLVDISAPDSQ